MIDVSVSQESRIKDLEDYLANVYVLFNKAQHYHWNVVGENFKDMHEFFESQYTILFEMIDEIAERIRAMGGFVNISMIELTKRTTLDMNIVEEANDFKQMLRQLLLGYIELVNQAKAILLPCEEVGDFATKHLLSRNLLEHEKSIWMINSLLS